MFQIVDAAGRSLGLPAYLDRAEAEAVADLLDALVVPC